MQCSLPWCCENNLLINCDKTKFVMIGTRQMMSKHSVNFSVLFMGRSYSAVESVKGLGVYICRLSHDLRQLLFLSGFFVLIKACSD